MEEINKQRMNWTRAATVFLTSWFGVILKGSRWMRKKNKNKKSTVEVNLQHFLLNKPAQRLTISH